MAARAGIGRGGHFSVLGLALACMVTLLVRVTIHSDPPPAGKVLDPGAWGSDHVGETLSDYTTGGECLFCHRKEIGGQWTRNRHHLTIRPLDGEAAVIRAAASSLGGDAQLVLGGTKRVRFLRRSASYGKLDLQVDAWDPVKQELSGESRAAWDAQDFGMHCAGCHSTGVDAKTHAFSSLSIDCFSCHGDIDLKHSTGASRMLLSAKDQAPARVTVSICAQCHIRTGTSRSTGRPYANTFVPGDNLFRDLEVSFADRDLAGLGPVDRHILENVRDVVLSGDESVTCLTCHRVHEASTDRHESLPRASAICTNCHASRNGKWVTRNLETHSAACRY
jgi:hypothetical protein